MGLLFHRLHLLDLAYAGGLVVSAPYWLLKASARAKVLGALRERMARGLGKRKAEPGSGAFKTVLIHAVSLGEINATRTLVSDLLKADETLRLIVSATTTAGFGRAKELYAAEPKVEVARYPLDFSGAVDRFLERYSPDVVVLMELELWPNFLRLCKRRGTKVVLVNGRLTQHSLQRYKMIGAISRWMLQGVELLCVQDEVYRERFIEAGAEAGKVVVTGTMKFDTAARIGVDVAKVREMQKAVGIQDGETVWVCGSTGPREEDIVLQVYRELLTEIPGLRLVIVPRKPERFADVAQTILRAGFALTRRSTGITEGTGLAELAVVLGDTLGELRTFFAMGDVAFVGRSLVDLGPKQHGSDMLESAALGKATVVGPFTGNFADAMHLLRRGGGVVEVANADELKKVVGELLADPVRRGQLGAAGRKVIEDGQGATARHVERVMGLLKPLP